MYSIQNWIYGVPLPLKFLELLNSGQLGDTDDPEELGFEGLVTRYHGGSDHIAGYIGIELGETDECNIALKIDTVNFRVSTYEGEGKPFSFEVDSDMQDRVDKMISALPECLKKILPPIGIYLVWSTS